MPSVAWVNSSWTTDSSPRRYCVDKKKTVRLDVVARTALFWRSLSSQIEYRNIRLSLYPFFAAGCRTEAW